MKPHALLRFAGLVLTLAAVTTPASAGDAPASAPVVSDAQALRTKVESAVERGAKAAAHGIERGAQAAQRGVKVGLQAAARGVETGAKAVARVADSVADKVGKP